MLYIINIHCNFVLFSLLCFYGFILLYILLHLTKPAS